MTRLPSSCSPVPGYVSDGQLADQAFRCMGFHAARAYASVASPNPLPGISSDGRGGGVLNQLAAILAGSLALVSPLAAEPTSSARAVGMSITGAFVIFCGAVIPLAGFSPATIQSARLHREFQISSGCSRNGAIQNARWYGSEPPPPRAPSIDPATRRLISPIHAAALCIKPRGSLTSTRAAKVDAPKSEWPDFAAMRRLAMQFRGILRSKNASKLATWLKGAQQSGLYAMQRFARTLRWDMDAVRNAISERWSNGQTERQINRLKTFKRATYGRAGPDLLHARMLPL